MCDHGDTVDVRVLVPAHLAFEGVDTWKSKPVDRCIALIVEALNAAGVHTVASCCGHGVMHGTIVLADGRDLQIKPFDPADYRVDETECTEQCGIERAHYHRDTLDGPETVYTETETQ